MIEWCDLPSCAICHPPQPARSNADRIGTPSLRAKCALALVRGRRRALFLGAVALDACDSMLAKYDSATEGC